MHQLAVFIPQPTQATVNTLMWIASLALQLALFAALFVRGVARRFPIFTTLIGFYLVRSALLFLIFDHVAPIIYHSLYNTLLSLDLLVQAAVAIEIILHLIRNQGGWTLLRGLAPIAILLIATICTALIAALIPAHAPIPVDRTQFFFSFLMILLFTWALSIPASTLVVRRITAGFALYGIVNVSANFSRTYAAIHNDAPLYVTWSYTLAGIYLLVVLFWLLSLKGPQNHASFKSAETLP